jgi:hypothetical protein
MSPNGGQLTAGNALAGNSGRQGGTDPPQTQLRERTCTQTCEHNQDCDGNTIQQRDRTRLNYPNEDSWLDFLLWLLGME